MEYVASTGFLGAAPVEELGKLARALGFPGIELPVGPGFACDAHSAPRELAGIVRRLREDHGVDVPIVTHGCTAFSGEAEALYGACAEAGVRFIQPEPFALRGSDWWDSFEDAVLEVAWFAGLSERHGVKTLIPISHGRSLATTGLAAWMLASYSDPSFVGVCYDPGVMAIDGEDQERGLGILAGSLGVVRARNCRYRAGATAEARQGEHAFSWVPLDEGVVSWEKVIESLRSLRYDGVFCISADYGAAEDRPANLARDLQYVRSLAGEASGNPAVR